MQFHLNGFRPGDPRVAALAPDTAPHGDIAPDSVDVLIVGSGPAGLTLAAQLAAFPDISTCLVERKSGPMELGQADGIACRTVEMFNAFGFAEQLLKEAYWVNETTFWKPDVAVRGNIVRSGRIQDTEDDLSEFPHVILNQARVHDFLLGTMLNGARRLEPLYGREVTALETGGDDSCQLTVTLTRDDGRTEVVRARYVVGCDGARSTVRQALGLSLHGDSANQAWGVMDVLAVTDFPDIRLKAAIHSANEGNILIIPREGGYLVRLYIEMEKLAEDERVASRKITSDQLVAAAKRILQPYSFEVKEIAWWSVYEIGQRLCERFDDGTETPCIFIVGDACHTHSPKAGQGMNVSMRDSFNLGWKLAGVLRGRMEPGILRSYSQERQAVAQELIEFDREFAKMFSAPPKGDGDSAGDGIDPEEFQHYFVKQGRFTAGTATCYAPSALVGNGTYQHLARGLVVGMRFHSAPVVRLADARPMQLGHVILADGRWRLFAFAGRGDRGEEGGAVAALCRYLETDAASPLRRYTPDGDDIDAVFDLRAVFQDGHRDVSVASLPQLLLPRKGRFGLVDHEKAFCPDLKSGQDIFDMRGIDRTRGGLVVVRPDQHVAQVLPLDAHDGLARFFDGILRRV